MTLNELKKLVKHKESSKLQFKELIHNVDQLAAEMTAFSNAKGGIILIGVTDDGLLKGIASSEINKLNQHISNAATNNILAPIYPVTENIEISNNRFVVAVRVLEGIHKPYCDKNRVYWIKNGSDKRKALPTDIHCLMNEVRSQEVLEQPLRGSSLKELNLKEYRKYYKNEYGLTLPAQNNQKIQILNNKRLFVKTEISLAGALLFSKEKEFLFPRFCVKAVSFVGNESSTIHYRDSEDFYGNIIDLFKYSMIFIKRNLHKIQNGKSFNSIGDLEIPEIVFEELIVNALIHRSYFIQAPIRVFIFDNRIEIISPGNFPMNLSLKEARKGVAVPRNPIFIPYAVKLLPYRGIGTGISRVFKEYKDIQIENQELQVVCSIKRKLKNTYKDEGKIIENRHQDGTKLALSWKQVLSKFKMDNTEINKLLKFCFQARKLTEIMNIFDLNDRTKFRNNYIKPLLKEGLLQLTIPEKPNSPNQKYYVNDNAKSILNNDNTIDNYSNELETNNVPSMSQVGPKSALSWHQDSTKSALSQHQVINRLKIKIIDIEKILKNCFKSKKLTEIMNIFSYNDKTKFRKKFIIPLLKEELLKLTIPETPNSPNQKYALTKKGSNLLNELKGENKNV